MENTSIKKNNYLLTRFEPIAFIVMLFGLLVLSISVFPFWGVQMSVVKQFLLVYLVLFSFIFWFISKIKSPSFRLFSLPILGIFIAPIVVSLLSSLSSGAVWASLGWSHFDFSSFLFLVSLFGLFSLSIVLFKNKERLESFQLILFLSALIIGVYQLLQLAKISFGFSRGWFSSLPFSLIGSWYDTGIFFGLIAVVSLIWLEFGQTFKSINKKYLSIILGGSLFLVVIINFYPIWVMLALTSLVILVTHILKQKEIDGNEEGSIFKPSMLILGLAILFLIFATPNGFLSKGIFSFYDYINLPISEIRPTSQSTFEVAKGVLKNDTFLGVGPNRFYQAWITYKPDNINLSPFWDINFNTGVGTMPTIMISAGILGFIAWAVFVLFIWFTAFRLWLVSRQVEDESLVGIYLSIVLVVVYLWVMAFVYNTGIVTTSLTFVLSGVLIAFASDSNILSSKIVSFKKTKLAQLLILPVLIFPLIFGFFGLYVVSDKLIGNALFYRSQSAISRGDLEKGNELLLKAIKHNSRSDYYYRTLAILELTKLTSLLRSSNVDNQVDVQKQFQSILDSAILSAGQAIYLDPQNYMNHLVLGQIYESLVPLKISGSYEKSLEQYNKARALNPKNPGILFNFARLEMTNGRDYSARDYLNESLAQKPNFSSALLVLAQIDASGGNLTEAINKTIEAVSLFPNDVGASFQLGVYLYQAEDYEKAILALNRVLELSPKNLNANAQYFLGFSYEAIGARTKALEQFESIQKYNPENQEIIQIINDLKSGRSLRASVPEEVTEAVDETDKSDEE